MTGFTTGGHVDMLARYTTKKGMESMGMRLDPSSQVYVTRYLYLHTSIVTGFTNGVMLSNLPVNRPAGYGINGDETRSLITGVCH